MGTGLTKGGTEYDIATQVWAIECRDLLRKHRIRTDPPKGG